MRGLLFKASLIAVLVLVGLCISVQTVKAGDDVISNWSSPTTNRLHSVSAASATDVWAVGAWGTTIHWNGSQWSNVTNPKSPAWFYSVFMLSAIDGWAVGARSDYPLGRRVVEHGDKPNYIR